jgi:hypothetical protein
MGTCQLVFLQCTIELERILSSFPLCIRKLETKPTLFKLKISQTPSILFSTRVLPYSVLLLFFLLFSSTNCVIHKTFDQITKPIIFWFVTIMYNQ